MLLQATGARKKSETSLISKKVDFKTKNKRDKEDHYIFFKGTIHHVATTVLNIYGMQQTSDHPIFSNKHTRCKRRG